MCRLSEIALVALVLPVLSKLFLPGVCLRDSHILYAIFLNLIGRLKLQIYAQFFGGLQRTQHPQITELATRYFYSTLLGDSFKLKIHNHFENATAHVPGYVPKDYAWCLRAEKREV